MLVFLSQIWTVQWSKERGRAQKQAEKLVERSSQLVELRINSKSRVCFLISFRDE